LDEKLGWTDGIIVQFKNDIPGRKLESNKKNHMDIKVPRFWTSNHAMTKVE